MMRCNTADSWYLPMFRNLLENGAKALHSKRDFEIIAAWALTEAPPSRYLGFSGPSPRRFCTPGPRMELLDWTLAEYPESSLALSSQSHRIMQRPISSYDANLLPVPNTVREEDLGPVQVTDPPHSTGHQPC